VTQGAQDAVGSVAASAPSRTKTAIKMAITMGLPFGLAMGATCALLIGWRQGLVLGVLAAAIFGAFMAALGAAAVSPTLRDHPSFEGETLLKHGPANHFVGIEGVGGWLYLTDKRLHFRPHSLNIQKHEWTAMLTAVASAEASRTLGIIPNGLRVATTDGAERFVVDASRSWQTEIASAKRTAVTSSDASVS